MSRTRALIAALLGAALATGCSPTGTYVGGPDSPSTSTTPRSAAPGDGPTDEDYAAVAQLMKRRARAINSQDEKLFLTTVDPTNKDFRTSQLEEFERMRDFGLVDVSYGVDHYGYGVPTVSRGDLGMRPGTFEHAQIDGIWSHPVGNRVDFTYARRDGRWYVAAETPPDRNDETRWVQSRPWGGDVVVERVDGLLVVVDADRDDLLESLAEEVDAAVTDVRATWQVEGENALLVDASSTGSRTMISEIGGVGVEAGAVTQPVYDTEKADLPGTRLSGYVIKVNPDDVADLRAGDVVFGGLLRHELTHYVLRRVGGPLWVTEGLADYANYQTFPGGLPSYEEDYLAQAKADTNPRELFISSKFNTYATAGYIQGFLAVRYLVGRFGVERVLDFAESYGRVDVDRGDSKTKRLLDEAFDLTPRQVAEAAYASYGALEDLAH